MTLRIVGLAKDFIKVASLVSIPMSTYDPTIPEADLYRQPVDSCVMESGRT